MITVDLPNRKLAVTFSHPTANPKNPEHGPNGKERRKPGRFTRCDIFEILAGGQLKPLCSGQTACSRADNFRKETGRKIALQRALCNHVTDYKTRLCKKCHAKMVSYGTSGLTQKERKQIWETYFNRFTKPPASAAPPESAPETTEAASIPSSQTDVSGVPMLGEVSHIPFGNMCGLGWAGMD